MPPWFTFTEACWISVFAFEVPSESTNRQQNRRSGGSLDRDPLGVDQAWGCDEHADGKKEWWLLLNTFNQVTG